MPSRVKFLIGLVAFTVIVRVLPCVLTRYDVKLDSTVIFYPWHFMPLTAVCLFSGAYVSDRRWSLGAPLVALCASDFGIWALTGQSFWTVPMIGWSASAGFMMATLSWFASIVCYLMTILLGKGAEKRSWPWRGLDAFGRGMIAECLFFIITNFVYFCSQMNHPHTFAGLIACYEDAIPFAGNGFASTAFYSVLLFSPLAIRAAGESRSSQSALVPVMSK